MIIVYMSWFRSYAVKLNQKCSYSVVIWLSALSRNNVFLVHVAHRYFIWTQRAQCIHLPISVISLLSFRTTSHTAVKLDKAHMCGQSVCMCETCESCVCSERWHHPHSWMTSSGSKTNAATLCVRVSALTLTDKRILCRYNLSCSSLLHIHWKKKGRKWK